MAFYLEDAGLRTASVERDLYREKSRDYFGVVKRSVTNKVSLGEYLGEILDIGGADGGTVKYLISEGRAESALVVDPYSDSKDEGSVRFIGDSADDLEIYDRMARNGAQFDTVMFLDVLEHLMNPWEVLRSVRKIHKPKGRLLVCMPNARFVAMVVPLVLWGRFDYKESGIMDQTHIRWFTRATTIELIEQAGYRVDKIDAYIEPRVALANKPTLGLFRRFFEYQYIFQATKVSAPLPDKQKKNGEKLLTKNEKFTGVTSYSDNA